MWNHLNLVHRIDHKSTSFVCSHCNAQFDNRYRYKRHVLNCLKDASECSKAVGKVNLLASHNPETIDDSIQCGDSLKSEISEVLGLDIVKERIGFLISHLTSTLRVPHSSVATVVSVLWDIIQLTLNTTVTDIEKTVKTGLDSSESLIDSVKRHISELSILFSKLRSPWKIKKFLLEQVSLQAPKEVVLGTRIIGGAPGKTGITKQVPKFDVLYHLSVRNLLEKLLAIPELRNQLHQHKGNAAKVPVGVYSDYLNGLTVRQDATTIENIVNVLLYFDEIEICNPLGSRAGKHKLGMTYLIIKDLPEIFQSKLKYIHLVTIVKSVDIKRYGVCACYQHIVEELGDLWRIGITTAEGTCFKIKLCQLVGDNLGLHQLLGFNESFSSNFPCRFCKAHRSLCQVMTTSDSSLYRTQMDFTSDSSFDAPSDTGIKERSIFLDLPYFCVSRNKAVDIMHDILEGVAIYDLNVIIPKLIRQGCFSLEYLNGVISSFNYGRVYNKTRPTAFKSLSVPNYSASQMFCFVQCLPLMVGHRVPEGNEVWELLLQLRDIIDFTFSPSISEAGIEHLRNRIQDHHTTFMEVSGDTLKPKFHHLVHYPDIIRELGPLKQYWVMRLEAKHRFAKRIANNICNFKNIIKSVAERYLLSTSSFLIDKSFQVSYDLPEGDSVSVEDILCSKTVKNTLNIQDDNVVIFHNVTCNGTVVELSDYLLYKWDDDKPCFGKVLQILDYEDDIYIVLQLFEIQQFDYHRHAYVINGSSTELAIKVTDLAYYHPLHVSNDMQDDNSDTLLTCPVVYV